MWGYSKTGNGTQRSEQATGVSVYTCVSVCLYICTYTQVCVCVCECVVHTCVSCVHGVTRVWCVSVCAHAV